MDEAPPHEPTHHRAPRRAVVVTGGAALAPGVEQMIDSADLVVAADSGLDRLRERDRLPHVVVGDLDSVSAEALAEVRRLGVPVETHPTDKDATDTELALRYALDCGVRSLTLLTGGGDRLDHVLGWLAVLAHPSLALAEHLDAWCATTHLQLLHGPRRHAWREPAPDAVVSLIPVAGPCTGVTTTGLRWVLADATLSATSSRGISNTVVETEATLSLSSGVLAIVRPHRDPTFHFTLTPRTPGGPE